MQDARTRYPSFEGRTYACPARTTALTATAKKRSPQCAQTVAEAAQRFQVVRDSMITVVALDDSFQPLSDDVDGLMHPLG